MFNPGSLPGRALPGRALPGHALPGHALLGRRTLRAFPTTSPQPRSIRQCDENPFGTDEARNRLTPRLHSRFDEQPNAFCLDRVGRGPNVLYVELQPRLRHIDILWPMIGAEA
jgi:hypothetical protein